MRQSSERPVARAPAIERGAQLAVLQSMARRQERHRVVERIGRRDQQRIERLKEIEPGALEQIAPIGQAPQDRVERRHIGRAAQPIQPQERGDPRSLRSVLLEAAHARRRGIGSGGVSASAPASSPFADFSAASSPSAAGALATRLRARGAPDDFGLGRAGRRPERQIVDFVHAHADDVDVDRNAERETAPHQRADHPADNRQMHGDRQDEGGPPAPQHSPSKSSSKTRQIRGLPRDGDR